MKISERTLKVVRFKEPTGRSYLALVDRETGELIPGQRSLTIRSAVGEFTVATVELTIDDSDLDELVTFK